MAAITGSAGVKLIAARDVYLLAAIGLIQGLRWLRQPRATDFAARGVAVAAYHFSRKKRQRIEENLSQWLRDGRSLDGDEQIVRRVFYETWRELLGWADADPIDPGASSVDVQGLEHLQRALDAGRGAILWESNGFGRRKLMKRVLRSHAISIYQVHGPNDVGGFLFRPSPSSVATALRSCFDRWEQRFVAETIYIPQSNSLAFSRSLINRLRGTSVVCLSGDGQVGRNRVPCRFLSGTISLTTGAVSLARLSGAPLLPVFCVEDADGGIRVIIEEPLPVPRETARDSGFESSLGQYAKLLDGYVRKHPGQYRNWHLLNEEPELLPISGRP